MYFLQYRDPNVGPAAYREGRIAVTKMFKTIQGEGYYAGHPAIFVRLAGCNRGEKERMGCPFCDTDFRMANAVWPKPIEIIQFLKDAEGGGVKPLVVITGGEPMMQDELSTLLTLMTDAGWYRIQIESNGDRLAKGFQDHAAVHLTVSPKYSAPGYRRPSAPVMDRANSWKILISADPKSPYFEVPSWVIDQLPGSRVYLSPITVYSREVKLGELASVWDTSMVNQNLTSRNYERAAMLALQFGFKVSMQQHLFFNVP